LKPGTRESFDVFLQEYEGLTEAQALLIAAVDAGPGGMHAWLAVLLGYDWRKWEEERRE